MTAPFQINQSVTTPRGSGLVTGLIYENAVRYILVRLMIPGQDHPDCQTPRGATSSLWRFEEGEIHANK